MRPPSSAADALSAAGLAFVAGAAVLVAEFGVVRVGGPWFGQSTLVWSNAVGVVLLALALGYAFGGRVASRGAGWRAVAAMLALAALGLAASASRLGPALFAWLSPLEVGGDNPLPLSLPGSLAATTVLAGPPSFLLGAASPLLVARLSAAASWSPGRAAGLVAAAGTAGSLVGAVLTPSLLIPAAGSRGAVALAALSCALAGIVALRRGRDERARGTAAPSPIAPPVVRPSPRAVSVAAIVGAAVTVLEFAASRALAPAFGSGNPTWATLVAVVLLALAAGNAMGGRWAGRAASPARRARVALAGAAAWSVGTAFLHPVLTEALAPTAVGTLASALLLFGPPMALLGAASPVLVRDLAASRGAARAAGAVFAAGTLGSVAGCYVTPLVLLPDVGTRATLLVCGVLLGATTVLWPRRVPAAPEAVDARPEAPAPPAPEPEGGAGGPGRPVTVLVGLATAASFVAVVLPRGPLRVDAGQLEERESAYQTIRVVESTDEAPLPGPWPLYGEVGRPRTRSLRFDEDRVSYQSVHVLEDEARILTAGRYYDHLALGAWFEGMPWTRAPAKAPAVLVVGYGGGTLHRILDLVAPEGGPAPEVTGVELDPDVVAAAREPLGGLPRDGRLFVGRDGRAALQSLPAEPAFDLVLVDAYQRTQYVPFHLATLEFFRACAARLRPAGAIGVNLHAPNGLSGSLLRAVATTLRAALPGGAVFLVPNPQYPSNVVVWGLPADRPPRVSGRAPETLAGPAHALDRLLVRAPAATLVLTDDRAPVEQLSDAGILEEAAR